MRGTVAERFWAKVDRRGLNDCWMWKAGVYKKSGYGQFRVRGYTTSAHRVAFYLLWGWFPPDDGCHSCNNRLCVNPLHIYAGTRKENMEQAKREGRHSHGASHGWALHPERIPHGEATSGAKLTESQVIEIRRREADGETHRALGAEYGVNHRTIGMIARHQRWAHVQEV